MRFKYTVEKNNHKNELILKEYTEIEADQYSLINEMVYDQSMVSSAVSKGETDLLSILRTENMYPPRDYVAKLSEIVTELLSSDKKASMEIIVDDLDNVEKKWKRTRRIRTQPVEEEPLDRDEVFEECTDNTCTLKNVDAEDTKPDLMEEMFPFGEVA